MKVYVTKYCCKLHYPFYEQIFCHIFLLVSNFLNILALDTSEG